MARPRGILAETSTNALVIASPRRLSTWDAGQYEDAIITTAPCRQAASGGVPDPSIVIWLRLVPDAGKLRSSK